MTNENASAREFVDLMMREGAKTERWPMDVMSEMIIARDESIAKAAAAEAFERAAEIVQKQFNACDIDNGRIPLACVKKQILAQSSDLKATREAK
jgi:glutamate synthase domain-containing protein 2